MMCEMRIILEIKKINEFTQAKLKPKQNDDTILLTVALHYLHNWHRRFSGRPYSIWFKKSYLYTYHNTHRKTVFICGRTYAPEGYKFQSCCHRYPFTCSCVFVCQVESI